MDGFGCRCRISLSGRRHVRRPAGGHRLRWPMDSTSQPRPIAAFRRPGCWPELVGIGRLDRISAGLAAVNISVWSGNELVAVGVCSSMLLAAGR
ncbi:hypothetical protein I553_2133 [Mycobacterium xenopi 4042]|uniref:Uncharacterized protein n=1 Tax=Mycobacterium xenopi 4042 TaxID=1299334 RepID=X8DN97_MYCXE|nr:hypothetical protein I553_2133 [Mycobacterium xenopi 4042]